MAKVIDFVEDILLPKLQKYLRYNHKSDLDGSKRIVSFTKEGLDLDKIRKSPRFTLKTLYDEEERDYHVHELPLRKVEVFVKMIEFKGEEAKQRSNVRRFGADPDDPREKTSASDYLLFEPSAFELLLACCYLPLESTLDKKLIYDIFNDESGTSAAKEGQLIRCGRLFAMSHMFMAQGEFITYAMDRAGVILRGGLNSWTLESIPRFIAVEFVEVVFFVYSHIGLDEAALTTSANCRANTGDPWQCQWDNIKKRENGVRRQLSQALAWYLTRIKRAGAMPRLRAVIADCPLVACDIFGPDDDPMQLASPTVFQHDEEKRRLGQR
ncbi:hypothetical protein BJ508DRAFT_344050 [Ascobolus immersus RN42]|uniref:Uncharacterized protein n=1 Tax=Ascobolus immersus RN42 TaxID=1160509 RepID=A0A3N4IAP1_ASCIM|nr:hypothetical protein BJ508DRAFT_344050 [Ascobolus immersus RN42]